MKISNILPLLALVLTATSCNDPAARKDSAPAAAPAADTTAQTAPATPVEDIPLADTLPAAPVDDPVATATSGIVGLDLDFVKRAIHETGFLTRANSDQAIKQFRILANISGTPEVWTTFSDAYRETLGNFIIIMSTIGVSGYPVDASDDFPFTPAQVSEIKTIAKAGMSRSQSAY